MSPFEFQHCIAALYAEPFSLTRCAEQALERLSFAIQRDDKECQLINAYWRVVSAVEHAGRERQAHASELKYHNRQHVGATLTAISCFLCLDKVLSRHEQLIALIAMAGHDYGHQGLSNKELGANQEQITADAITATCLGDLEPTEQMQIASLIMGTDPQRVSLNHQRYLENPQSSRWLLQVLVNEADIAASLMPMLGDDLTRHVLIERGSVDPSNSDIKDLLHNFKAQARISSAPARELLEPFML